MRPRTLPLLIAALLACTACTDPSLHAGITIGPGGVAVSPAVSVTGTGGTITYQP